MNDVLQRIVDRTRARMSETALDGSDSRAAADSAKSRRPFVFLEAVRRDGINIIAEIKAASPSAGTIVAEPAVREIAASYAEGGAAAISVVTEPEFFRGSTSWIAEAREGSGLPVVMKDFILSPVQVLRGIAAGADALLLLAALLSVAAMKEMIGVLAEHGCDALVEVHDEAELEKAMAAGARIIGVNNRNLRTFEVDLGTSERLAPLIGEETVRVAESGIRTRADIDRLRTAGFNAFLVGESLLRQKDRAAAVKALRS